MTSAIIQDVEDFINKIKAEFKPEIKEVENDVKSAASATLAYIEKNGLQDAYQIAMTIVGAAVAGSPWGATLAAVEAAVVADGKTIEKGAVAVVSAQAQADLIAAGTIAAPAAA